MTKKPQTIKVLIVEDQPEIQESIRISIRALTDFDPEFREASDGEEGLARLQAGFLPDVIISDIMMPVMDGLEFCQKVKESHLWCSIPFIFLTAKAGVRNLETGMQIGAVAYIEKPFDPRVLSAAVQSQVLAYWQLKEQLSKRVNTLLSVFSHESGTALNNILGFTDLLRESSNLSEEHKQWLNSIYANAKRLEKLRRKSASLIEFQHAEFLPLEYDQLPALLNAAINNSLELSNNKGIEIIKNFSEVPLVPLHRPLMMEALMAVLENAIEYNPKKGKIFVSLKVQNGTIALSIMDEGPGISPERSLEIFEPFVTVSNVLNHQKGTGLSLAIARRIMELHQGTLVLENQDSQKGAKFTFRFPNQLD